LKESNKQFKLKLNLQQREIEVEGPNREFVEEWFDKLSASLENSSHDGHDKSDNPEDTDSSEKEKSIAEIYDRESFSKKQERTLFIGWALEKVQNQTEFTREEIQSVAKDYKIQLGANLNRDINSLIRKGWLKEVGERDGDSTYYLTRTGENFVEEQVS